MASMILYNLKAPDDIFLDLEMSQDLPSLLKCTGIYDGLINIVSNNLCESELNDEIFVQNIIAEIINAITKIIKEILRDLAV